MGSAHHADPGIRDRIAPLTLSSGNELRQTGDPEEQLTLLGLVGMVDITDICRALIGLAPLEEKET